MSHTHCEVHARDRTVRWVSQTAELALDETPDSPWLMIPADVRRAFDGIRAAGIPLANSLFSRPLLGVKTGCNDAFIVRIDSVNGELATIRAGERSAVVERSLLRPVVRGESLVASALNGDDEHIIWPHDECGMPLKVLPPLAKKWLSHHRHELSRRTDLHHNREWWSLFRVESGRNDKSRVIWNDIGKRPRAVAIDEGNDLVPLNTCYAVRCPTFADALAFKSLLNSPLIAAWLDVISEPARGGYHRYLGWTMALLPIPAEWGPARDALTRASGASVARVSDEELLAAALAAYGLARSDVEPLLRWTGRSR